MNPNPPMYVLQTLHDHSGSLHSLMFYLKLTRELLFYSGFKSAIHGLWQLTIEFPVISYCICDIYQTKYLIPNRGRYTF